MSAPKVIAVTTMMPTRAAGTALVSFGSTTMSAIVGAVRPSIVSRSAPSIQAPCCQNMPSCDTKMTIASPLTKPIITGAGIIRTNLPKPSAPAAICRLPARVKVANRFCSPVSADASPAARPNALSSLTRKTMTTAMAPVAPELVPGRPPNKRGDQPPGSHGSAGQHNPRSTGVSSRQDRAAHADRPQGVRATAVASADAIHWSTSAANDRVFSFCRSRADNASARARAEAGSPCACSRRATENCARA